MFSKIKVASGLLCVLAAFCIFQLVTEGLGFWSMTRTHDDVNDLANVALHQVDAVNETTQHLMDARINLSRAGTRMVRGGAEPTDIVQHRSVAGKGSVVQRKWIVAKCSDVDRVHPGCRHRAKLGDIAGAKTTGLQVRGDHRFVR